MEWYQKVEIIVVASIELNMVRSRTHVIHRGSRSTEVRRCTGWESVGLGRNHRFDTGTVAHLRTIWKTTRWNIQLPWTIRLNLHTVLYNLKRWEMTLLNRCINKTHVFRTIVLCTPGGIHKSSGRSERNNSHHFDKSRRLVKVWGQGLWCLKFKITLSKLIQNRAD